MTGEEEGGGVAGRGGILRKNADVGVGRRDFGFLMKIVWHFCPIWVRETIAHNPSYSPDLCETIPLTDRA